MAAGLTQAELAERIGVSQQQVQKDEAGARIVASLERLHGVAALLHGQPDGQARLPARGGLQAPPSRDELIHGRVLAYRALDWLDTHVAECFQAGPTAEDLGKLL